MFSYISTLKQKYDPHLRDDLAVAIGKQSHAAVQHQLTQLHSTGHLTVVRNGQLAQVRLQHKRLRSHQLGAPRSGVAGVANGDGACGGNKMG